MSHHHKCTYDRNELRVLRAGFEEAAELFGLETDDVGGLTDLAIAVFGLVRGADLNDGDKIVGVDCRWVERDDKTVLALWISVADNAAHEPIGLLNDVAREKTLFSNRAILRRMSLKQQPRKTIQGADGASVRLPIQSSHRLRHNPILEKNSLGLRRGRQLSRQAANCNPSPSDTTSKSLNKSAFDVFH